MELSILMPCLNEAETIRQCITRAVSFLERSGIAGEVLIADNGSTDGSQEISTSCGARVIDVPIKGYGAALISGISAAHGKFVIMGDSDDSYDFSRLEAFVERLRAGEQLVMGNRFLGGIEKGAMPLLHRYLGNPVLSFIGRLFFKVEIRDFHCGLRGFHREAIKGLHLESPGMEFASEMVVKAKLHGLTIGEVPTTLRPDGRSRPPHLRTWRDGWRHLKFLLTYSPTWLFLYPGLLLLALGLTAHAAVLLGSMHFGKIAFGIHTLLYSGVAWVVGLQLCLLAIVGRRTAEKSGALPASRKLDWFHSAFTLERGLLTAGSLILLGLILGAISVKIWVDAQLGPLIPEVTMRTAIPSAFLIVAGAQISMYSFVFSLLEVKGAVPATRRQRHAAYAA